MKREQYIHSTERVRMLEKGLLSREQLMRMADAGSAEECFKVLAETRYLTQGQAGEDQGVDRFLSLELEKLYATIAELDPEGTVTELLRTDYEAHNLKLLAKESFLGLELSALAYPFVPLDRDYVKAVLGESSSKTYEDELGKLLTQALKDLNGNINPQRIDLFFDQYAFAKMKRLAKALDAPILKQYVRDLADFINVETLFRIRKLKGGSENAAEAFVPGGLMKERELLRLTTVDEEILKNEIRRLSFPDALLKALAEVMEGKPLIVLEKRRQDYLRELNLEASKVLFGPEVLFAYVRQVENEIRSIRIILNSLRSGLSSAEIKERLSA